ncbi:MAG TPA: (Fe-S)-binding protein, partial [Candidatus Limnocylindrales bacterium]|nr:(Fe-S)-binding protein [Candidatus Limnocylindrales bacterium]
LASAVEGVTVNTLPGEEECCGFGGTFSVKMPEISGAMLKEKVAGIEAADAEMIVTGDASCLMQMNGGLQRKGSQRRVVHIADLLAQGLVEET